MLFKHKVSQFEWIRLTDLANPTIVIAQTAEGQTLLASVWHFQDCMIFRSREFDPMKPLLSLPQSRFENHSIFDFQKFSRAKHSVAVGSPEFLHNRHRY